MDRDPKSVEFLGVLERDRRLYRRVKEVVRQRLQALAWLPILI